jgi:hypothetical protein
VEESRTTWLLMGLIALAGRLAAEEPKGLAECFPEPVETNKLEVTTEQTA